MDPFLSTPRNVSNFRPQKNTCCFGVAFAAVMADVPVFASPQSALLQSSNSAEFATLTVLNCCRTMALIGQAGGVTNVCASFDGRCVVAFCSHPLPFVRRRLLVTRSPSSLSVIAFFHTPSSLCVVVFFSHALLFPRPSHWRHFLRSGSCCSTTRA
jgi:hypothetical protein